MQREREKRRGRDTSRESDKQRRQGRDNIQVGQTQDANRQNTQESLNTGDKDGEQGRGLNMQVSEALVKVI